MSTYLLGFYTDNYAPATYGSSNLTKQASHKANRNLALQNASSFTAVLSIFNQLLSFWGIVMK